MASRQGSRNTVPTSRSSASSTASSRPVPEQAGISSLLVANPDIQGIMTQGYCTPVFNAMKNAGKASVPATCFAYNGEMLACAADGNKCAILSASPSVIQQAMEIALDSLDGKSVPALGSTVFQKDATLYTTANATVPLDGIKVNTEALESGKNVFPDLPQGMALPYSLPEFRDQIKPAGRRRQVSAASASARFARTTTSRLMTMEGAPTAERGVASEQRRAPDLTGEGRVSAAAAPLFEMRGVTKAYGGRAGARQCQSHLPCRRGPRASSAKTAPARAR